jgi:hypothetical protein
MTSLRKPDKRDFTTLTPLTRTILEFRLGRGLPKELLYFEVRSLFEAAFGLLKLDCCDFARRKRTPKNPSDFWMAATLDRHSTSWLADRRMKDADQRQLEGIMRFAAAIRELHKSTNALDIDEWIDCYGGLFPRLASYGGKLIDGDSTS